MSSFLESQAQEYHPRWLPTGDSEFEVGTQLRPRTIADEGMETIFENFSMADVNSVYFLALYSDLAANYDLDYIQTCQYVYSPNDVDKGGTYKF